MIEVPPQLADRRVEFLAKCEAVELVEHGLVISFDHAVGLRALGLGAAMVDILDGEIELIFEMLGIAAIFRAPIGQPAPRRDAVLVIEGQDPRQKASLLCKIGKYTAKIVKTIVKDEPGAPPGSRIQKYLPPLELLSLSVACFSLIGPSKDRAIERADDL